jgi:DNA-binding transcriptional regulator YiaG
MIHYPHFAVAGLYLSNGYKEVVSYDRTEREYERHEELEQAVRRILLRKPERLRGWDLRFLRRGLGLSQTQFGAYVDRDAQTVARWEKNSERIPAPVDLTIRVRFAQRFEPLMTIEDLTSYVDGRSGLLPKQIILTLGRSGWSFEFDPWIKHAMMQYSGSATIGISGTLSRAFSIGQFAGPAMLTHKQIDVSPQIPVGEFALIDASDYLNIADSYLIHRTEEGIKSLPSVVTIGAISHDKITIQ